MRMLYLIAAIWSAIAVEVMAQSPALTETMNFAPIPVGARREVRLRIERLPSGGYYQVAKGPSLPFAITSDPQDLVVKGNEIQIRVEFAPNVEGEFRDEVLLQRVPAIGQSDVDLIRIRLFATAFRIERSDDLEFGAVMTGDTLKRAVLYRANRNDEFSFEYLGSLSSPFTMLTAQGPVRRGFDTLAVVIGFAPLTEGTYADTIGVIRKDRQGRRLDTAYIRVSGVGRIMPTEKVVELRDLVAGDYATRTVVVDLPQRVYSASFSYSLESRSAAAYTSATINAPNGPSTAQQITINVIANPQRSVDERSVYVLLRKGPAGNIVDSTRIILDVKATARPVTLRATFDADTINARIGDTLVLNLRAQTTGALDEDINITSLRYALDYNPTVFIPLLDSNQQFSVEGECQRVTTTVNASQLPIRISASGDVVALIRAVVALGDAETSMLTLSGVEYSRSTMAVDTMQTSSSMLRITNVWRYGDGRPRLVNPLQDILVLDVDPNPVTATATMRIRNLPRARALLQIVDALGGVRADVSQELAAGRRDFTIATSGSADAVLEPGTYYARCIVESLAGGTLNSVVRVFVVQ